MRKIILSAFLTIMICLNATPKDIFIPDQVRQTNLNTKFNLTGTKVFIEKPANYTFIKDQLRLQKDQETYIQFVDVPGKNFTEMAPTLINKFDELEKQGGNILYKKKFKLGIYDAYFYSAPKNNSEQLALFFGDNSFVLMAVGFIPKGNDLLRDEILKILLTVDYNKALVIDPLKNLNFDIDLSNSPFKFNQQISMMSLFTINGEGNPNENFFLNDFIVTVIAAEKVDVNLKEYSDNIINKLRNNTFPEKNVEVKIISEKKKNKDGIESIEVLMQNTLQGRKFKSYQMIKKTKDGLISFSGQDITPDASYIDDYVRISESIKIKKIQ